MCRWRPEKLLLRSRPWAALAALFAVLGVQADERILHFHSDIQVHPDSSLTVTESIRVRAEGQQIRRGIYREFPTRYRDRLGNRYRVRFDVLGVQRNGTAEPYHTEQRSNGIVVYMGSAGSYIQQGVHEYQLRYRTHRQLGYFTDYDELYWNVTGNGWDFTIDQASARIVLPESVNWQDLRTDFYTGPQDATGGAAEVAMSDGHAIEFRTTAPLPPSHGLTIAIGWPKGIVARASIFQRLVWFFGDNKGALALLFGLLATLAWYLRAWNTHGRDPRKGVIIPRFKPPQGLSAAACRYVLDMALHSPAFTAAIISLGVKGHLKIDDQDDEFVLYRQQGGQQEVSEGEAAVLTELLPVEDSWIDLDDAHYRQFQRARAGLEHALKSEHHGRLFRLNSGFMAPAVILSILSVMAGAGLGAAPYAWVLFAVSTLALHGVFAFLLRAPTPLGRRIMDEIEGFRMYLDTAEQDRLDRMRSPALTPEVFEMFLPFAFALGVENHWCERFAREFPQEVRHFEAGWYTGRHDGASAFGRIGNQFGSGFSSAISSASTPPGSASGSGGGGSSGGGGGGGGGGGW
jgi:uncharacterized membrane protein YgcG